LHHLEEISSHIAVAVQNMMVIGDLKHSREELVNWSHQLEKIVDDRTRALREAIRTRKTAYQELDRSHQKLKRAQSALVEREKMTALGLLGAGVAHEINNPLGFVNANLATLEQYVRSLRRLAGVVMHARARAKTGSLKKVTQIVEEAGRIIDEEHIGETLDDLGPVFDEISNGLTRITGIVEQLRVFAEEGGVEGVSTEVDVNIEIERLVDLVRGTVSKSFQIDCRFSEVPVVSVPVKSLRQILLSIFSINARVVDPSRKIIIRTKDHGEYLTVDLIDRASSLSEQDVSRLFDPFFEPGSKLETGGLSLSAAWGMARSLGGGLRAFLLPEGGMCIQLSLSAARSVHTQKKEQVL